MPELDRWLTRMRDGDDAPATIAEVRRLLAADDRIPADLRDPPDLDEDPAGAAAALLALLGHDDDLGALLAGALRAEVADMPRAAAPEPLAEPEDLDAEILRLEQHLPLPIAEAIRARAGDIEIAGWVVERLGGAAAPVAAAVRSEAGFVDVSSSFGAELPIAAAVRAEAGFVDVSSSFGAELPIAAAVRAEAGLVDVSSSFGAELPIAAAVRAEAGFVDVSSAFGTELPIAAAVRSEAGRVEVAAAILDRLDARRAAPIRVATPFAAALAAEAGTVDLADAILAAVGGAAAAPLAAAVRAEAGTVAVADAVVAAARRSALAVEPEPARRPANGNRAWGVVGVLVALAAMMLLVVGRIAPLSGGPEGLALAGLPDFAVHDEIRVEDLSYGPSASAAVIPFEDDAGNGVLVIWVEEESGV
jgi:hypothetical protein